MRLLTREDWPTLDGLLARLKTGEHIDAEVAKLLNVEEKPYSTSTDAGFELMEQLFALSEPKAAKEYLNIDFRYYPGSHYICDLKWEYGEVSCRTVPTRCLALLGAVLELAYFRAEE